MARFREVFRFMGVDENPKAQGVVIPAGGSNIVALEGADGAHLSRPKGVTVSPMAAKDVEAITGLVSILGKDFKDLGRVTLEPAGAPSSCKFLRVSADQPVGLGTKLTATRDGKEIASLGIVVLWTKTVKVAVRPVLAPNAQGQLVRHGKEASVRDLLREMNLIWQPQANVVFTDVPGDPATVTREEIIKALGLKPGPNDPVTLPDEVDIERFREVFLPKREPKAAFTMFLVKGVTSRKEKDNGATLPVDAFALLADRRSERTAAHEAGHWLGTHRVMGDTPVQYGHPTSAQEMLMRDGGAGRKIPFDQVAGYFNNRYSSK